jgi:hypothetical protein
MDTYHINLSKTNWGTEILYSGTVMKIRKPIQGQRNTVSMAESIARKNQNQAIDDIIREAQKLDFTENEIIFIPTFERLTSLADLTNKLNEIGQ